MMVTLKNAQNKISRRLIHFIINKQNLITMIHNNLKNMHKVFKNDLQI